MTDDDDKAVIICAPVDDHDPIEGCVQETCTKCETPVWLAPSGQRLKAQHNADVVCMNCASDLIREEPDVKFEPLTNDQIEEVRAAILKEFL